MTSHPDFEYSLPSVDPDVRLVCVWAQDRFQHTLQVWQRDRWLNVITSVEGTSEDPWPSSPPVQELHRHQHAEGACLLAVGKAGKAHWSMSLESLSDQAGFRWDVACRLDARGSHPRLQSTYGLAEDVCLASVDTNPARLAIAPNRSGAGMNSESGTRVEVPSLGMTLTGIDQTPLELSLASTSQACWLPPDSQSEHPRVTLDVEVPKAEALQTVRWIYEMVITGPMSTDD